jgi:uncharacterized caspase-like protein
MTSHRIFVAAALIALGSLASPSAWAQAQNPRIALVIGDAAYPDHPLATTANDAGLVAQTLQAAGFDVVGAADLDQNALRGALRDFLDKAAAVGPNMQAFVYLAGRGVQYDGDNYFVPVDARIARDADIPIQAVKISDFSHALAATPGRARIIVMDGARANFFGAGGSSLAGGLGLVDADDGTLMAFNAAPGTVAPDEPGPYGVYGKSLAGALRAGGLPIDDVFAQVRLAVNQQTNGAVVPWSVSKVAEPYAIFERAPDAPAPAAPVADIATRPLNSFKADEAYSVALDRDTLEGYQEYLTDFPRSPQARRVRAILAARREAIFWRRSVNQNSPRAYWTYLRVYPQGPHVGDARRRLTMLSAQFAPPADFAPEDYADAPPPPPDELVYGRGPVFIFDDPDYGPPPPPPPSYFVPEEDADWRDLPPPRRQEGLGYLPVLPLAIPLLLGAKAVFHKDKAGQAQGPAAPPPLPPSFKPHSGKNAPIPPSAAPATQPSTAAKPLPVVTAPATPAAPKADAAPATQPLNAVKPLPGGAAPATPGAPKGNAAPATQPLNAAKPLPGVAAPATEPVGSKALQPELKPGPKEIKAAPLESKPAPKEFKAAPLEPKAAKPEFKAAPLEPKAPKPEFKAAPKEFKSAPLEAKPAPQPMKAAPAPAAAAPPPKAPPPAPAPAKAPPPPPPAAKAPPPAPAPAKAPPPAAAKAPPGKPACGAPNQPCPK